MSIFVDTPAPPQLHTNIVETLCTQGESRLDVLDGWRGISILSVLGCHLLPLGPKSLRFNEMAGAFGMSLFFTLSGFLITTALHKHPNVKSFFIRRLCRILPLAYLYIIVVMVIQRESAGCYTSHFLFLINYQTSFITDLTGHFWSLCVEIHFYLVAGLIVLVSGRRGLWALPLLGLGVTIARIVTHTHISIVTHLRADEILAGAIIGLMHITPSFVRVRRIVSGVPSILWLALLLFASHPLSGAMNYIRPYFAMALVGSTLWGTKAFISLLKCRGLRYAADTSYALYVIHPLAAYGWFSTGSVWLKYCAKRPLTFLITLIAAHFSTFYYEKKWINWGKKWSASSSLSHIVVPKSDHILS